jgi:cytochrome c oxidase subunit 2
MDPLLDLVRAMRLSGRRAMSSAITGGGTGTNAAARRLDARHRFRHDAPADPMATAPFAVFVAATLLILVVFAAVARSARDGRAVDYGRVNRLRLQFFIALAVVLVLFLLLTLRRLPYPVEARAADRIVNAIGKQYAWSLTDLGGPTLATWDREFSPVVEVKAGTSIEFRVTTLDVNHGFSLYAPDGRLVAQTQAMPGYMNRLRVTFDQIGTYTVLCLEFCGMSHHRMRAVVEVR